MRLFDTHAHFWDARFAAELGKEGTDALLAKLLEGEVPHIVNVATDLASCHLAIAGARRHGGMLTALGIHPTDGQALADPYAELEAIEALLADPASHAVAIGEIGLDYHYPDTRREAQLSLFRAQMQMARSLAMPVVIHDRDAHRDVMTVVREFPDVVGIFHSFSGDGDMARELAERGYYLSFSGTVSFKSADGVREAAAAVPHECLLLETDAPYLAPHPHRGKLNHSGYLTFTNAALAAAVGLTPEECAELTYANACRIFGL